MEINKLPKREEIKKQYGRYYREESSDSEMERALFEEFLKIKLRPEKQYPIDKYFCDLAFPEYKIDIEYDGEYHLQEAIKERDNIRDEKLESLGWKVVRVSKNYINGPNIDEVFTSNMFLMENILKRAVKYVFTLIRAMRVNKETFLTDYASCKLDEDGLPKMKENSFGFEPIGELLKGKLRGSQTKQN